MRKLYFLLLACCGLMIAKAQNRWDRTVELTHLEMKIEANEFTATTHLLMEFRNNRNSEAEGLFKFTLLPGQVITAFQLELNGKFRDGSIEEKWKATNAYNTIVGKRIDPALLTMEGSNSYSLRIFPFSPGGTRRVTMTIHQQMEVTGDSSRYHFPLAIDDKVGRFECSAVVQAGAMPVVGKGLLDPIPFREDAGRFTLQQEFENRKLFGKVSFSIPLRSSIACRDKENRFAFITGKELQSRYEIKPGKLVIYWDRSASAATRNHEREVSFLKNYFAKHPVEELVIYTFNHRVTDSAHFDSPARERSWINFLLNQEYSGATHYGSLKMKNEEGVVHFIFSDGKNSYGRIVEPSVPYVYVVHAAPGASTPNLVKLVGRSGGTVIDLRELSMNEAIAASSEARYWITSLSSPGNSLILENDLPMSMEKTEILFGTTGADSKWLEVGLGHGNQTYKSVYIPLQTGSCVSTGRLGMLRRFRQMDHNYWENNLEFGLKEKVVTYQSAYIVLERVEDYIKYNITPPPDLEEACERMNFVKKDTRQQRAQVEQNNRLSILQNVLVQHYRYHVNWYQELKPVNYNAISSDPVYIAATANTITTQPNITPGTQIFSGSEVVVTALGMVRQPKELGYSVSRVRSTELLRAQVVNLQQGLTGKVSGVNIATTNSGVFQDTRITLRGIRSLTGNNEPMLILDGTPVDLSLLNSINPNDIQDVTILKSTSGTAIYGPDGANGALVVTTKRNRGGYWNYSSSGKGKYKNFEDEDYLVMIRQAPLSDKIQVYETLKREYPNKTGFYFDMAQHFFESGLLQDAKDILMTAIEINEGLQSGLKAAAFILESWGEFEKALEIYESINEAYPWDMTYIRDRAWINYRMGRYQQAIDILAQAVLQSDLNHGPEMLTDLNMIISVHKDQLDLSRIPQSMIRPLDADLRVIVDANYSNISYTELREPGQTKAFHNMKSNNGGFVVPGDDRSDYFIRNAPQGTYRVVTRYYHPYYLNSGGVPPFFRIIHFENFGRPDQRIKMKTINMENLAGEIEIDDFVVGEKK